VQVVEAYRNNEHVVTSAQFLIDAESSLRDAVRSENIWNRAIRCTSIYPNADR